MKLIIVAKKPIKLRYSSFELSLMNISDETLLIAYKIELNTHNKSPITLCCPIIMKEKFH